MKPKKKSQSQSASRQRDSNSRGARSETSAKRKSRQLKSDVESLRVATPEDSEWLSQKGLIVPDDLEPSEERVSLDFTSISNRSVGAVHSRFAVRHSHALFVRASVATRLLRLRRKHRLALAKFRVREGRKHSTVKSLEETFSIGPGKKIENTIMQLEVKAEILDALIGGFEDIVKAASREMSRRDSERAPRD